jgi:ABC-type amino acid transport substrate-binding protein
MASYHYLKNEKRSQYMLFSDSVFDQTSIFWYKKSKHPDGINWNSFTDISDLKLGMLIGGFIDKEMEETFEASKGIHRGKSVENLFQVLLKERVDLVAIDESVGRYVLNQKGWQDDITMTQKPISLQESYIGLSKKSKVATLLDEINKAITKLHKEGTIEKIRTTTDY